MRPWLFVRERPADLSSFYFGRRGAEDSLRRAFEDNKHILIYGPPRQGKTTLVRRATEKRNPVVLHASKDFCFSDIARNVLLSLGCSITIEQKKKRKLSTKAEIQLKWPLTMVGGSLQGDAEAEQTARTFTAEIGNPNDVCHLLREVGGSPVLILERFEQLATKERRLLLDFLRMSAETKAIQVILVASSLDLPIQFRERIGIERYLSIVALPPLSDNEMQSLVAQALKHLRCPESPELSAAICSVIIRSFGGSLDAALDACTLVASRSAVAKIAVAEEPPADQGAATILDADLRERAKAYFMTLLTAVVEADWTVQCAHRIKVPADLATPGDADSEGNPSAGGGSQSHDPPSSLMTDPVFRRLYDNCQESTEEKLTFQLARLDARSHAYLVPICEQARALGEVILRTGQHVERVRLLAFAIATLLESPTSDVVDQYQYAYSTPEDLNLGVMIIELLLEADLTKPLHLNETSLLEYFAKRDLIMLVNRQRYQREPVIAKCARRLRRLQRKMQVEPPIFIVNAAKSEIVLWDPQNLLIFGDIKDDLRQMLENIDPEAGGPLE